MSTFHQIEDQWITKLQLAQLMYAAEATAFAYIALLIPIVFMFTGTGLLLREPPKYKCKDKLQALLLANQLFLKLYMFGVCIPYMHPYIYVCSHMYVFKHIYCKVMCRQVHVCTEGAHFTA